MEKHFSLSRDLWGSDHKVSLVPEEFQSLVERVKNSSRLYKFSGSNGEMRILQDDEAVFRPVFRKSLVAGCDIPADTVITSQMLYAMRPQKLLSGFPSEQYESVLGRRTSLELKRYDPIWENSFY